MSKGLITLLTDFGLNDEFVGVMKGVIAGFANNIQVIDICHNIPPQDIYGAAYMLEAAYSYFPNNSVHVCVVDPGVGSDRKILGACANGHNFIAPNNGILTFLHDHKDVMFYDLAYETPPYATFHGRDVIAGLAARLATGTPFNELGRPAAIQNMTKLTDFRAVKQDDGKLCGRVVWHDNFGNLVTNIRQIDLERCFTDFRNVAVTYHNMRFKLYNYYEEAVTGAVLALLNSRGCLELALNNGNLFKFLQLNETCFKTEVTVFK